MSHIQKNVAFAAILLLSATVGAQTYTCEKNSKVVDINGVLNEESWVCADSFLLVNCIDGSAPKQRTVARAFWDSTNLYLGVVSYDSDIWATYTARDGELWKEEVIELFLDPDGDGKNYLEFEFNCLGAMMDMLMYAPWGTTGGGGTSNWTAQGIKWAVKVHGTANSTKDTDTSMVLEVSVPWAALKDKAGVALPPKPGITMKFNVYRIDGRYIGHNEAKEYSCYRAVGSPPGSKFHSPDKFAAMSISNTTVCPTIGVSPARNRGRSQARAKSLRVRSGLKGPHLVVCYGAQSFRLDGCPLGADRQ